VGAYQPPLLQLHFRVHLSSEIERRRIIFALHRDYVWRRALVGRYTETLLGELPSGVCPVPSHFFRLIARFPFTSFAVAAITGKKDADRRSQSHSDSERDAERAERALFDLILRVVNQVFRRAAALFDSAFCRDDAIVDRASHCFLHAFNFGF